MVWRLSVYVVIIGFCINSVIWALEILFRRVWARFSGAMHVVLHISVTTLGGTIGYLLGRLLATLIVARRLPTSSGLAQPLLIVVAVSFFAGASMMAYLHLESRLRDKIRETELAEHELTLARAFQERLLPPPELSADGYRVTARNLPAYFVAGDFYDFITRSDGSVVVVVADVAGKGVAASLIMASVKSVLPMIASVENVDTTMRRLNEKLTRELGKREFVALTCASYEPATGRVTLANAGLPDPYLIRDGVATPIVVDGPRLPLGIRDDIEYQSLSIELQPGDRLLMLTDGLPEAAVGEEPLGYDRLAAIAASSSLSIEALFGAIEAQTSGARSDDWTAVLLERLG